MRQRFPLAVLLVACWTALGCERIEAIKDDLLGRSRAGGGEDPALAELRALYESGSCEAVLARAAGLAAERPSLADIPYYQGLCHLERAGEADREAPLSEDEQASLEAFARALSINPRHAPASVGIGDLYSRRLPARTRHLKRDDPESPYVLAREAYERAVTIDPRLPEAQRQYASFLERTGELESAEAAYRAAAEAAATIPEVAPDYRITYGRFLAGPADRLDDALEQFELARMFRPDDRAIQQEIAILHSRLGLRHLDKQEYLLAEDALTRAQGMFPDGSIPEAQKTSDALKRLRTIRRR